MPRCSPCYFGLSVCVSGAKTRGQHKETAFHRHPLARAVRGLQHSLGGTPAIFRAQLVFSEVRCSRERSLTFWGRQQNLSFHCLSLKSGARSCLPRGAGQRAVLTKPYPVCLRGRAGASGERAGVCTAATLSAGCRPALSS